MNQPIVITGIKAQAYLDAKWERENCNSWWTTKRLTDTVFGLDGIALDCKPEARQLMTKLMRGANLVKVRCGMRQSGLNVLRVKRKPYGKRKLQCSKPSASCSAVITRKPLGRELTAKQARLTVPVSLAAAKSLTTSKECR